MRINKNKKFLGPVLAILLLSMFTMVAFAEDSNIEDSASAGAQAIAIGDETETVAQATVNDDGASSSATSKAKAENGGTAIAMAEAWANWIDGSSAYARAMATAVAGIGESIWAEATAQASVSSDGTTDAHAGACVGESGCIDPDGGDGGNGNGDGSDNKNSKKLTSLVGRDFFGFTFGKSDPGRYYYFKKVANYNGTDLRFSDSNNTKNVSYLKARAKYYMETIVSDRGVNSTQYENLYKEVNYTEEVNNIIAKEGFP